MKSISLAITTLILLALCQSSALAKNAAGFNATLLSGETISYTPGQQNNPTLLVVWASWCRYCMAEMPELIALASELKDKLTVIGINVDKNPQNGRDVVTAQRLPYHSVSDPDLVVADKYNVRGTPDLFLIDINGDIVQRSNRLKKIINKVHELTRQ